MPSDREQSRDEKLVVLFVAAIMALTYPLLGIADVDLSVGPVPVLWVWLFGVWAAVIVGLVVLLEGT